VHVCQPKRTLPFFLQYKLANAGRPVYFLIFLVAYSEIWTTDPGLLQPLKALDLLHLWDWKAWVAIFGRFTPALTKHMFNPSPWRQQSASQWREAVNVPVFKNETIRLIVTAHPIVFLNSSSKGFRRVRKISKSDHWLRHVCPSVRTEQFSSHWMDIYDVLYLSIYRKYINKIQVLLKSDKNDWHFAWRSIYVFNRISLSSSYNEKCFRQKL
jgi:hypothetical protein